MVKLNELIENNSDKQILKDRSSVVEVYFLHSFLFFNFSMSSSVCQTIRNK